MRGNNNKPYILLWLIIIISACGTNHDQVEIILEDGVEAVINPKEPYFGELALDLEEDLVIGGTEDDNQLFYRARDIVVDEMENIYIADRGNFRVQIFDRDGRYLKTIGRKGQGPGEFASGPLELYIDRQNYIFVLEYRKLSVFHPTGDFIKSMTLDYHLASFAIDEFGNILGYAEINPRDPAVRGIVKFNPKGELLDKIAEYTDRGIKIILGKGATYTLTPNHSYTPRLLFSSLGSGVFVFGYPSEYLFHLIDTGGNVILKIRKKDTPIPISSDEKKFFIDQAFDVLNRRKIPISRETVEETLHFDENRAFFDRLITDDKQRLYVRRVKSVLSPEAEFEFDLFDREGSYLYHFCLPFTPSVISKGCIYVIHIDDETGDERVQRFKIKNWDRIQERIPD